MTPEDLQTLDRALTKAISYAVAFADNTPHPDDPRWTPWSRFGKPMAERCENARKLVRAEQGR